MDDPNSAENNLRNLKRFKNCKVEKILGRGGFGIVYKVDVKPGSGETSAVKLTKLPENADNKNIQKEAQILSKLNHPNIVKFKGIYAYENEGLTNVAIEMEFIDGKPLSEFAVSQDLSLLKRWMKEICEAVQYIHSQKILHEDLKGDNVMVTSNGTIKIIDFGIAKVFKSSYYIYGTECNGVTKYFLSPEKISYWMGGTGLHDATGRYGKKSDVFAIGCIVYELCEGKPPNEGGDTYDLLKKRKNLRERMPRITSCSDSKLIDFYERATEKDMERRANIEELLSHPFLRDRN